MFLPWPAMLGQQRSLLITEPKDRADESGVSIIPRYAKFCGTMEAKPLFQFVRRSWLFLTLMKVFTKSSLDTGLCLCFLIPNLKPQSHHNQEMQCFSCWCQPLPLTGDPATPPPAPAMLIFIIGRLPLLWQIVGMRWRFCFSLEPCQRLL